MAKEVLKFVKGEGGNLEFTKWGGKYIVNDDRPIAEQKQIGKPGDLAYVSQKGTAAKGVEGEEFYIPASADYSPAVGKPGDRAYVAPRSSYAGTIVESGTVMAAKDFCKHLETAFFDDEMKVYSIEEI